MRRAVFILISLLFFNATLFSQEKLLSGFIKNNEGNPISVATIIIQTLDSIYIDAVVSNELGAFSAKSMLPCHIIVQHLNYETVELDVYDYSIGDIVLNLNDNVIDGATVVGQRPLVQVVDGVLKYDVGHLAKDRVVSTAYDAIMQLPGVREDGGQISLAGTSGVSIIINGQPSTLGASQLMAMLKQMPASYIETAEVMYSTPPQYHIRGAAINLIVRQLDNKEKSVATWQGEVNAGYTQKHYDNYSLGAIFFYNSQKITSDFLYSYTDTKTRTGMDLISHHTIGVDTYDIEQHNTGRKDKQLHRGRLGIGFKPNDKNNISFTYNTYISPNNNSIESSHGTFSNSQNIKESDEQMHNLSLDYTSGFGFKTGANYTFYKSPATQYFSNSYVSGDSTSFISESSQKINTFMAYADQSHKFDAGWKFNYGGKLYFAEDRNFQNYKDIGGDISLYDTDTNIREYIYDFYSGFSKSFSQQLSMNLSITGEYYKFGKDEEWSIFPQAQLTYVQSAKNIYQFSFSSDKTYPRYWEKQDYIGFYNGYVEIHGNPGLKAYNKYSIQLSYIRNRKYIFTLYYLYQPDYADQLAYQAADRLALIYQTQNWDYNQTLGMNVIIPFKIGNRLSSRLTFNGFYQQSKSDYFHDISFNNEKFIGYGRLDNSIKISSKPNIVMELSGYYMTEPIQGIYNLTDIYNVDVGMKLLFANQKAELRLKANDVFNSVTPNVYVQKYNQNYEMIVRQDSRSIVLSFAYKFGGFQAKEVKEVDRSRFGL